MVPGITFFIARAFAGRRRLFLSRRGAPVPGITLIEAFVWLGIVPLAIYALTFAPGYWLSEYLHPSPVAEKGLIGFHEEIFALQSQLMTPHRYMSTWPQWVLNLRGIWYLYEAVDGAQRGVLLLNNSLTVEAGQAGSHAGRGWDAITDACVAAVAARAEPAVFILWGSHAQKKASRIAELNEPTRHCVIRSPHPSPLSAHRGFFGSKPFSRANEFLQSVGRDPVDWSLA